MVSILGATDPLNISCSRLSDSGEDAKVNGKRGKVGGAKKFPVSFRFIFVFVLQLIQRARLSRSLEQATLKHENDF